MPQFAKGVPRVVLLLVGVVAFCLVSPETLARGPDFCLWRWIFHLQACPACGSTRALAAFFHGRFAQAWVFNHNIVITAPLTLSLLIGDVLKAVTRSHRVSASRLSFQPESPTLIKPE